MSEVEIITGTASPLVYHTDSELLFNYEVVTQNNFLQHYTNEYSYSFTPGDMLYHGTGYSEQRLSTTIGLIENDTHHAETEETEIRNHTSFNDKSEISSKLSTIEINTPVLDKHETSSGLEYETFENVRTTGIETSNELQSELFTSENDIRITESSSGLLYKTSTMSNVDAEISDLENLMTSQKSTNVLSENLKGDVYKTTTNEYEIEIGTSTDSYTIGEPSTINLNTDYTVNSLDVEIFHQDTSFPWDSTFDVLSAVPNGGLPMVTVPNTLFFEVTVVRDGPALVPTNLYSTTSGSLNMFTNIPGLPDHQLNNQTTYTSTKQTTYHNVSSVTTNSSKPKTTSHNKTTNSTTSSSTHTQVTEVATMKINDESTVKVGVGLESDLDFVTEPESYDFLTPFEEDVEKETNHENKSTKLGHERNTTETTLDNDALLVSFKLAEDADTATESTSEHSTTTKKNRHHKGKHRKTTDHGSSTTHTTQTVTGTKNLENTNTPDERFLNQQENENYKNTVSVENQVSTENGDEDHNDRGSTSELLHSLETEFKHTEAYVSSVLVEEQKGVLTGAEFETTTTHMSTSVSTLPQEVGPEETTSRKSASTNGQRPSDESSQSDVGQISSSTEIKEESTEQIHPNDNQYLQDLMHFDDSEPKITTSSQHITSVTKELDVGINTNLESVASHESSVDKLHTTTMQETTFCETCIHNDEEFKNVLITSIKPKPIQEQADSTIYNFGSTSKTSCETCGDTDSARNGSFSPSTSPDNKQHVTNSAEPKVSTRSHQRTPISKEQNDESTELESVASHGLTATEPIINLSSLQEDHNNSGGTQIQTTPCETCVHDDEEESKEVLNTSIKPKPLYEQADSTIFNFGGSTTNATCETCSDTESVGNGSHNPSTVPSYKPQSTTRINNLDTSTRTDISNTIKALSSLSSNIITPVIQGNEKITSISTLIHDVFSSELTESTVYYLTSSSGSQTSTVTKSGNVTLHENYLQDQSIHPEHTSHELSSMQYTTEVTDHYSSAHSPTVESSNKFGQQSTTIEGTKVSFHEGSETTGTAFGGNQAEHISAGEISFHTSSIQETSAVESSTPELTKSGNVALQENYLQGQSTHPEHTSHDLSSMQHTTEVTDHYISPHSSTLESSNMFGQQSTTIEGTKVSFNEGSETTGTAFVGNQADRISAGEISFHTSSIQETSTVESSTPELTKSGNENYLQGTHPEQTSHDLSLMQHTTEVTDHYSLELSSTFESSNKFDKQTKESFQTSIKSESTKASESLVHYNTEIHGPTTSGKEEWQSTGIIGTETSQHKSSSTNLPELSESHVHLGTLTESTTHLHTETEESKGGMNLTPLSTSSSTIPPELSELHVHHGTLTQSTTHLHTEVKEFKGALNLTQSSKSSSTISPELSESHVHHATLTESTTHLHTETEEFKGGMNLTQSSTAVYSSSETKNEHDYTENSSSTPIHDHEINQTSTAQPIESSTHTTTEATESITYHGTEKETTSYLAESTNQVGTTSSIFPSSAEFINVPTSTISSTGMASMSTGVNMFAEPSTTSTSATLMVSDEVPSTMILAPSTLESSINLHSTTELSIEVIASSIASTTLGRTLDIDVGSSGAAISTAASTQAHSAIESGSTHSTTAQTTYAVNQFESSTGTPHEITTHFQSTLHEAISTITTHSQNTLESSTQYGSSLSESAHIHSETRTTEHIPLSDVTITSYTSHALSESTHISSISTESTNATVHTSPSTILQTETHVELKVPIGLNHGTTTPLTKSSIPEGTVVTVHEEMSSTIDMTGHTSPKISTTPPVNNSAEVASGTHDYLTSTQEGAGATSNAHDLASSEIYNLGSATVASYETQSSTKEESISELFETTSSRIYEIVLPTHEYLTTLEQVANTSTNNNATHNYLLPQTEPHVQVETQQQESLQTSTEVTYAHTHQYLSQTDVSSHELLQGESTQSHTTELNGTTLEKGNSGAQTTWEETFSSSSEGTSPLILLDQTYEKMPFVLKNMTYSTENDSINAFGTQEPYGTGTVGGYEVVNSVAFTTSPEQNATNTINEPFGTAINTTGLGLESSVLTDFAGESNAAQEITDHSESSSGTTAVLEGSNTEIHTTALGFESSVFTDFASDNTTAQESIGQSEPSSIKTSEETIPSENALTSSVTSEETAGSVQQTSALEHGATILNETGIGTASSISTVLQQHTDISQMSGIPITNEVSVNAESSTASLHEEGSTNLSPVTNIRITYPEEASGKETTATGTPFTKASTLESTIVTIQEVVPSVIDMTGHTSQSSTAVAENATDHISTIVFEGSSLPEFSGTVNTFLTSSGGGISTPDHFHNASTFESTLFTSKTVDMSGQTSLSNTSVTNPVIANEITYTQESSLGEVSGTMSTPHAITGTESNTAASFPISTTIERTKVSFHEGSETTGTVFGGNQADHISAGEIGFHTSSVESSTPELLSKAGSPETTLVTVHAEVPSGVDISGHTSPVGSPEIISPTQGEVSGTMVASTESNTTAPISAMTTISSSVTFHSEGPGGTEPWGSTVPSAFGGNQGDHTSATEITVHTSSAVESTTPGLFSKAGSPETTLFTIHAEVSSGVDISGNTSPVGSPEIASSTQGEVSGTMVASLEIASTESNTAASIPITTTLSSLVSFHGEGSGGTEPLGSIVPSAFGGNQGYYTSATEISLHTSSIQETSAIESSTPELLSNAGTPETTLLTSHGDISGHTSPVGSPEITLSTQGEVSGTMIASLEIASTESNTAASITTMTTISSLVTFHEEGSGGTETSSSTVPSAVESSTPEIFSKAGTPETTLITIYGEASGSVDISGLTTPVGSPEITLSTQGEVSGTMVASLEIASTESNTAASIPTMATIKSNLVTSHGEGSGDTEPIGSTVPTVFGGNQPVSDSLTTKGVITLIEGASSVVDLGIHTTPALIETNGLPVDGGSSSTPPATSIVENLNTLSTFADLMKGSTHEQTLTSTDSAGHVNGNEGIITKGTTHASTLIVIHEEASSVIDLGVHTTPTNGPTTEIALATTLPISSLVENLTNFTDLITGSTSEQAFTSAQVNGSGGIISSTAHPTTSIIQNLVHKVSTLSTLIEMIKGTTHGSTLPSNAGNTIVQTNANLLSNFNETLLTANASYPTTSIVQNLVHKISTLSTLIEKLKGITHESTTPTYSGVTNTNLLGSINISEVLSGGTGSSTPNPTTSIMKNLIHKVSSLSTLIDMLKGSTHETPTSTGVTIGQTYVNLLINASEILPTTTAHPTTSFVENLVHKVSTLSTLIDLIKGTTHESTTPSSADIGIGQTYANLLINASDILNTSTVHPTTSVVEHLVHKISTLSTLIDLIKGSTHETTTPTIADIAIAQTYANLLINASDTLNLSTVYPTTSVIEHLVHKISTLSTLVDLIKGSTHESTAHTSSGVTFGQTYANLLINASDILNTSTVHPTTSVVEHLVHKISTLSTLIDLIKGSTHETTTPTIADIAIAQTYANLLINATDTLNLSTVYPTTSVIEHLVSKISTLSTLIDLIKGSTHGSTTPISTDIKIGQTYANASDILNPSTALPTTSIVEHLIHKISTLSTLIEKIKGTTTTSAGQTNLLDNASISHISSMGTVSTTAQPTTSIMQNLVHKISTLSTLVDMIKGTTLEGASTLAPTNLIANLSNTSSPIVIVAGEESALPNASSPNANTTSIVENLVHKISTLSTLIDMIKGNTHESTSNVDYTTPHMNMIGNISVFSSPIVIIEEGNAVMANASSSAPNTTSIVENLVHKLSTLSTLMSLFHKDNRTETSRMTVTKAMGEISSSNGLSAPSTSLAGGLSTESAGHSENQVVVNGTLMPSGFSAFGMNTFNGSAGMESSQQNIESLGTSSLSTYVTHTTLGGTTSNDTMGTLVEGEGGNTPSGHRSSTLELEIIGMEDSCDTTTVAYSSSSTTTETSTIEQTTNQNSSTISADIVTITISGKVSKTTSAKTTKIVGNGTTESNLGKFFNLDFGHKHSSSSEESSASTKKHPEGSDHFSLFHKANKSKTTTQKNTIEVVKGGTCVSELPGPQLPPSNNNATTATVQSPALGGATGGCNIKTGSPKTCICCIDKMVQEMQERFKGQGPSNASMANLVCESFMPMSPATGIVAGQNLSCSRGRREITEEKVDSLVFKRDVLSTSDVEAALSKGIDFLGTDTHKYSTPGSRIRIPCAEGKNITTKDYTIKWTVDNGLPVTEGKIQETCSGYLIIDNIVPEDAGNYTCTISNNSTGIRSFNHELSVITLPKFDINTTILYDLQRTCNVDDVDFTKKYFTTEVGSLICGNATKICTVNIQKTLCLANIKKNDVFLTVSFHMEPMSSIFPMLNSTQCDVVCQLKIYSKLALAIVNNVQVFNTQPLITLRGKLTPTHDNSSETTDSPKLIIGCPPGFGLLGDKHICITCGPNTFSNGEEAYCNPCPKQQFQPNVGSKSCIPCSSPFQDPNCLTFAVLSGNKYKWFAWLLLPVFTVTLLIFCCAWCRKDKGAKSKESVKGKKNKRNVDIESQQLPQPPQPQNKQGLIKKKQRHSAKLTGPDPPPPDF